MMRQTSRPKPLWSGALLALTLSVCASARAGDWTQLRGDTLRTGVSSESLAPPLSLLWRFSGGQQSNNSAAPVIAGDTAFFVARSTASGGGNLFAIDVMTGAKRWEFPGGAGLPERRIFPSSPTIVGNKVYVTTSDGVLYVLDAKTGKKARPEFEVNQPMAVSPVVTDGAIYLATTTGTLYALKEDTYEQLWRTPYSIGDPIVSAPLVAGGMIYLQTQGNVLHALAQSTGTRRWNYRIPRVMQPNTLTFVEGTLLVPNGNYLTALQARSGNTRWQRIFGNDVLGAPLAEGGVVYVSTKDDTGEGSHLYALKNSDGKEVWAEPAPIAFAVSSAPLMAGSTIYLPLRLGRIAAVSREDGKTLWQYRIAPSFNRVVDPPPGSGAGGGAAAGGGPTTGSSGGGGNSSGGSGGGAVGEGSGSGLTAGGGAGATLSGPNPRLMDTAITAPLSLANGTLYVVSNDGTLSAFRPDAPDSTPPSITYQYPKPGQAINGRPPFAVAVRLSDVGSGIDPDSVKLLVDDEEKQAVFDLKRSQIGFEIKASGRGVPLTLADGRHSAKVIARDWRGNAIETEWSFVVDNSLPANRRNAPVINTRPSGGAQNPASGGARGGFRPGGSGTTGGGNTGGNRGGRGGGRSGRGGGRGG